MLEFKNRELLEKYQYNTVALSNDLMDRMHHIQSLERQGQNIDRIRLPFADSYLTAPIREAMHRKITAAAGSAATVEGVVRKWLSLYQGQGWNIDTCLTYDRRTSDGSFAGWMVSYPGYFMPKCGRTTNPSAV